MSEYFLASRRERYSLSHRQMPEGRLLTSMPHPRSALLVNTAHFTNNSRHFHWALCFSLFRNPARSDALDKRRS
jgi:hypothetical protein